MGKTTFIDGDIANKIPGTRVLAGWLNKVFNHRHDGRDQDGSAPLDFAADTGAVNAIVAAMAEPLDALTIGLPLYIQVGHTNTGSVILTVDGFGPHPLHKLGGLELGAGDIQATQIIQVAWDGTNFQLLSYNSPPVTDAATLQGHTAASLAPPGIKGEFFMPTAPSGWLPCDGRTVLRTQYPDLFAAIGTTWGAGDNMTTFQLPEVRGEFFRGWDNGRGVDPGREFGSWQQDQIKSHNHSIYTSHDDGSSSGAGAGFGVALDFDNPSIPSGTADLSNTAIGSTGGNGTWPRNIAVLVCIKY